MTISGREQVTSDIDHQFNDPHILPVHLYRAPPPSYSEVQETKQNSSCNQPPLQVQGDSSHSLNSDSPNQDPASIEAPPAYENIQPCSN